MWRISWKFRHISMLYINKEWIAWRAVTFQEWVWLWWHLRNNRWNEWLRLWETQLWGVRVAEPKSRRGMGRVFSEKVAVSLKTQCLREKSEVRWFIIMSIKWLKATTKLCKHLWGKDKFSILNSRVLGYEFWKFLPSMRHGNEATVRGNFHWKRERRGVDSSKGEMVTAFSLDVSRAWWERRHAANPHIDFHLGTLLMLLLFD